MPTVRCSRCHEEREALAAPPFRAGTRYAALGEDIARRICAPCYREWLEQSIRLVNEHRIDLTDPAGHTLWMAQLRAFLGLEGTRDPWARFLGRRVRVEPLGHAPFAARLVDLDAESLGLTEFDPSLADAAVLTAGRAPGSARISRDAVITLEGEDR